MRFKVITRGAPRPIAQEFLCPVHGHFTAIVDSGTDEVPCCHPRGFTSSRPLTEYEKWTATNLLGLEACGLPSPWSPSRAPAMRMRRVEAVKGRDETPEHPDWNFTRNLEEGQDFEDWQADRDAAAEERRKQLVMEMARSER